MEKYIVAWKSLDDGRYCEHYEIFSSEDRAQREMLRLVYRHEIKEVAMGKVSDSTSLV